MNGTPSTTKGIQASPLQYSELPERAAKIVPTLIPPKDKIAAAVKKYSYVKPRQPDKEGDTEVLAGVTFTHHFVYGPGDSERVLWHYAECGPAAAEVVVFLHGIPDSWFQWHHQMAALADRYRCISVDLKGYGQSEKGAGSYRYEEVSEQLHDMLKLIPVTKFNLVTHDRGTVLGDFMTANHPDSVLRYGRGEQHLYHFHPSLAPQGEVFRDAPWTGIMENPLELVCWTYTFVCNKPVLESDMERVIQEFSYPGTSRAVPRWFNSSTFRAEWLERRNRLLAAWKCPILIMQGYDSKTQPREFYEKEDLRGYMPNAKEVDNWYLSGGHFWSLESVEECTEGVEKLLKMEV
jgi:pimeloyl-ACP methyl ester carboxylesterase